MWLKTDAYPMKTSAFSTTATVDSPIQKGTRLRANMHALQQHRSKNSFFIPPSLLPLPSSHLTLSQTDPLDRHSLTLTQAHWEQSKWPKLVSAVKSHRGISFAKELESNSPDEQRGHVREEILRRVPEQSRGLCPIQPYLLLLFLQPLTCHLPCSTWL